MADDSKPTTRSGEITNICDVLLTLDAGQLHADVSRDLREGLARDQGTATTKLTINLTFKTSGQNGQTEVKGEHKVQAPRPKHPAQTLHVLPNGTLSERDPRQQALPGMRVAGGPRALRTVGKNTADDSAEKDSDQ